MGCYVAIPYTGTGSFSNWCENNGPQMIQDNNGGYAYLDISANYWDSSMTLNNPITSTPQDYAVYFVDDTTIANIFSSSPNYPPFLHRGGQGTYYETWPKDVCPGTSVPYWEYIGDAYYQYQWPDDFGEDEGVWGVKVYVFGSQQTLSKTANSWSTIDSYSKEIYCNQNSVPSTSYPNKVSISVTSGYTYTFSLYTYAENNYDGIMISTNGSLTYSNIYLNSSASSTSGYIGHCTGLGSAVDLTYTAPSTTTIYVYFKTDTSSISNYSCGYSYGRYSYTVSSASNNTITYNPYNNSAYCTTSAAEYTTMQGSKTVTISTSGSCLYGTPTYTLLSVKNSSNVSQSGWSLSSNGRQITIPSGAYSGVYTCSIRATSQSGGGYIGTTVDKSISITINSTYITDCTEPYNIAVPDVVYGDEPVDIVGGYITQETNCPASAITLTSSNVGNYFSYSSTISADWEQVITYNNGAQRSGTLTFGWSGSGTLPSLGTTETYEDDWNDFNNGAQINLMVYGECNKSAVADSIMGAERVANTVGSWSTPSVSYSFSPNPYQFAASGGSVTLSRVDISASGSITRTWTSGSTESLSLYAKSFGVKTYATGISGTGDGNGNITVKATNNTSTDTRGTYVVRPIARYGSAGGTAHYGNELSFTQAAGAIQYATPVIDTYDYALFAAGGATQYPYVEYHQDWTWNGVADSGGTNYFEYTGGVNTCTSGSATVGSLAFTAGTLSAGFSKATNFATNGRVTAATRGTDYDENERCTTSALSCTVTVNSLPSGSKTCTSCCQDANIIETYGSVNTPTVTQKANFPCGGVTLSNSNISTYYNYSATQSVTYSSGSTGTIDVPSSGLSWTYTDGTIAGRGNTLDTNTRTVTDFSIKLTASNQGKSNSKTVSSGTQAANPISTYGSVNTPTVTQHTCFPCNGVTLTTSNVGSYFSASATQNVTLCSGGSTTIPAASYAWTITSGTVASRGTTIDSANTNPSINIKVRATGGGTNKYADKTVSSGCQIANTISSYGNVGTPTVTQTACFPCGGVTLTTSNIGNYFSASATQSVTLCSGSTTTIPAASYTWTITSGTVSSRGANIDTANTTATGLNIKVRATGGGTNKYADSSSITSGCQIANTISSYGNVGTPTISQHTCFPCGGVTLTASNVESYYNHSSVTQSVTLCSGSTTTIPAASYTWTVTSGTVNSRGANIDTANTTATGLNIKVRANGGGSKYADSTATTSGCQTANTISTYGTVGTPTISQHTCFPCGGVTLTTSNIESYFSHSNVTQSVTLCSGSTTTIAASGYTWTITSGTVSSRGTTIDSANTNPSINIKVRANGGGSKYADSAATTSGCQTANTISSYGNVGTPTISQHTCFPCDGVTLTTSNIESYFSHSSVTQSVTLCSGSTTTIPAASYTWTVTSGSVASRGTNIDSANTNPSINIKVRANGGGSKYADSAATTSGCQTANTIASYGNVGTPTISQTSNLPCDGITLTTSNVGSYFSHSSVTQSVTLCSGSSTTIAASGYTWTVTSGSVASWGNTLSNSTRSVSINIKVTASGGGSKSTDSAAKTTATQAANPIAGYGSITTPTVTQIANFPCGGVTLTTSNISTYFTPSGSKQTVTLCSGGSTTIDPTGYTWTCTNASVASRGNNLDNNTTSASISGTVSVVANGGGSKTSSAKSVTSGTQAANPIATYGTVGTPTISQIANFPCGGVTLSASNIETYFNHSSVTQSVTLCSGGTTTIAPTGYTWTITSGTVDSRGNTLDNNTRSVSINIKVTANGGGSKSTDSAATTSGTQAANPIASYGAVGTPTISWKGTNFPCDGVTLTTSNIETYYSHSSVTQSVTLCSGGTTTISPTGYTWNITNGSVASWGNTLSNATRAVSGLDITITANGGGSKSATSTKTTSGTQAANPIASYGAVGKPTISQVANFPCDGVTLTTSNIETYFSHSSVTQSVTLCSGGTTTIAPTGYTWTITSGSVASRGNTLDNNTRSVSINIKVTASGGGSKSTDSDAKTSGTQAANPIASYGAVGKPTITQTTNFPCGGVTLTTSNIGDYFSHSSVTQSVTLCSGGTTTINPTGYTWTITSGTVDSRGNTLDNNTRSVSINIKVTASGGGSKSTDSDAKTSGTQAANPIATYGAVGKPTISQTTNFPCGGVTLTTSNIGDYFSHSTVTQSVTLCSGGTTTIAPTGYTWTITSGSVASRGNTLDNNTRSVSINIKVTANGGGSKSTDSDAKTSGTQASNPISSYGAVGKPTISQIANLPCNGVTLSTTNIETYFSHSSVTQSVTLCSGGTTTIAPTGYTWTITNGTVASRGTTIDSNTRSVSINISVTASGGGSKSTTSDAKTSATQAANPISTYGDVSTPTVTQIANFPCNGVTLTTSNVSTYFTPSATQSVTLCSGSTTTIAPAGYTWTITNGSVASRGTTIDNNTTSKSINISVVANGGGSKNSSAKSVTSGTQAANPITSYGTVGTPTITQIAQFPCNGVTLTTSNISTYFSYSTVTQSVTLCSGSTTTINPTGYSWSGNNVTIPSLGKTTTSTVTARDINFTITASGGGSKSSTATVTSGNQAANPVTYGNLSGNPTITQIAQFPCGGVTLTTSNISTYFSYGTVTQTKTWCSGSTESGTITYAWSGSNVSIPSLGKTTTSAVTARDINFTITATGEGSKTSASTVTSGNQAANPVTYGNVSTPSITQIAQFPCGGVTLTSSNISTYFTASASQTKTWCSGSTEAGTVTYSWSGNNYSIPSLGKTTTSTTTSRSGFSFTVTASGEGSKSNTNSVTSGNQAVNPVTYGNLSGNPTISQKANFPCGGVTLTTSNISDYFEYTGVTQTKTWCSGSTEAGTVTYAWSGSNVSIPSLGKTTTSAVTARTINFTLTATGEGSKTSASTVTSGNQAANPVTYGNVSAPTVTQKANFPASGVTLTTSNIGTYFNVSGSSQTKTWCSGSTEAGTVSYSWSITNGSVPSKGTTVSGATSVTINITAIATGEGSKSNSKTVTSGTQGANALESISFTANSTTISYQGTTTGTVTATYTSGSSKNVSNDSNTSYTDESNPDIVTFTKNS